jgi:hypothetical protein
VIQIEYRYPWTRGHWSGFGSAKTLANALELLDLCRVEHPGSECRIRRETLTTGPGDPGLS